MWLMIKDDGTLVLIRTTKVWPAQRSKETSPEDIQGRQKVVAGRDRRP
jgi:hypothetical protein